MPYYETVFLARQDISSSQAESLTESFANAIKENGGTVASTEFWGLRNLAYKIKKNRKAHYVLFNIDAPSPAVLEMERQMRLNEDVLRHLTVKVDALAEGPSKIMQSKSLRDDRPRHSDDRPRHHAPPQDKPRPVKTEAKAADGDGAETDEDGAKTNAGDGAKTNAGDGAKTNAGDETAPGGGK